MMGSKNTGPDRSWRRIWKREKYLDNYSHGALWQEGYNLEGLGSVNGELWTLELGVAEKFVETSTEI